MERKRALAIAAATTATLGCAIVAGASIGGYSLLGFGSSHKQGPGTFGATLAAHQKSVTKYRDVYDKYVVDTAPSRVSRQLRMTRSRPRRRSTRLSPPLPAMTRRHPSPTRRVGRSRRTQVATTTKPSRRRRSRQLHRPPHLRHRQRRRANTSRSPRIGRPTSRCRRCPRTATNRTSRTTACGTAETTTDRS